MSAYTKPPDTPLVRFGKVVRKPINRWIARSSRIPNTPFLDRRHFDWAGMLESRSADIRNEVERLLQQRESIPPLGRISPDHRRVADNDKWRSFFLEAYGYKIDANRARCPITAECIDQIPGLVVAFFSIMEPGTHIPRHKGVSKALVNVHLALIVPSEADKCRVAVNGQVRYWREGQLLILDDTYPHEVWNDTDELRAILFLQVKRPVALWGSILGRLFLWAVRRSSYVQEARTLLARGAVRRAGH